MVNGAFLSTNFTCDRCGPELALLYLMHAKQGYLNRNYSILEQKRRVCYCIIFQADLLLFGSIMMFDSGMFFAEF